MSQTGKRNVWILGGTGFIGQALVSFLSKKKENNLHLLLHKNAPYQNLEPYNTIMGELGSFEPFWFERYPPDIIFHLARPAGSNYFSRYLKAFKGEQANRRLADAMLHLEKKPVVVYVSGSLMYGERKAHEPAREDSPLNPYAFARHYIRNEKPWIEMQQKQLLDVRFARPGWIVGAGSWFESFFWNHYLQTGKVPCYGTGEHMMPLIHVDDCASMIDALSRYGGSGQNLNIFAGPILRHRDFCLILAELLRTTLDEIPFEKARARWGGTVAQALVSNVPMQTLYPEVHEKSYIRYPDPEALLFAVVRQLKNV